jgi:hypothetical protein
MVIFPADSTGEIDVFYVTCVSVVMLISHSHVTSKHEMHMVCHLVASYSNR